jgi:hypothetical protein
VPPLAAGAGGGGGGRADGDGEGDLEGTAGGAAAAVLAEAARWEPTPVELDDARLVPAASFDIIATLVGIYGNTLFISEYKCAPVTLRLPHMAVHLPDQVVALGS